MAPKVCAYAYHHGQFDYDRVSLAPMGCAVQCHIRPKQRKSWGDHSLDGWYIGTSPKHYRCHIIFIKATRSKCILDTVFFKHKYITQSTVTPANVIIKALQDLTHAVQGQEIKGESQLDVLTKLHDIFAPGHKHVPEHTPTLALHEYVLMKPPQPLLSMMQIQGCPCIIQGWSQKCQKQLGHKMNQSRDGWLLSLHHQWPLHRSARHNMLHQNNDWNNPWQNQALHSGSKCSHNMSQAALLST